MKTGLKDDGLITPEVKEHSLKKYELIRRYSDQFATAMKKKWQCRVFIDLFAGAGKVRIEKTAKIIPASPLLALGVDNPFDKYFFCELDKKKSNALKKRISNEFPQMDVSVIQGDSNKNIGKIVDLVLGLKASGILSFCVVDPYKIADLKFDTIRQLSKLRVDFLVLIPTHMDVNRNEKNYIKPENKIMDDFLGKPDWRGDWLIKKHEGKMKFGYFVLDAFGKQMETTGYLNAGIQGAVPVQSEDRKNILYYLTFYSKHELGMKFWEDAKKYADPQTRLFY